MSLGLCCHYLSEVPNKRGTYQNILKQRVLQLGRWQAGAYSEKYVRQLYIDNVNTLITQLPDIFERYKVFRFPSGIFPLYDVVPREWWDNGVITTMLSVLGNIVKAHGVRATFHPGQFCSLTSDDSRIIANSVREINHHAWIFDEMKLPATPFHAINVHGGKSDRQERLAFMLDTHSVGLDEHELSSSARARITLENDESCYSVIDLLEIHKLTGVPIVFDSHHHTFNDDGIDMDLASKACKATWLPSGCKPLQHISNSDQLLSESASFIKRRAHSDYIWHIPECQRIDVVNDMISLDVECKMKNLAVDALQRLLTG
jgi:UV DNA damage endonuclease